MLWFDDLVIDLMLGAPSIALSGIANVFPELSVSCSSSTRSKVAVTGSFAAFGPKTP